MAKVASEPSGRQRETQRLRILNLLIEARGGEVPSYELARAALQYNARILELRRLGYRISSRTERIDGKLHGFYRLDLGPAQHALFPQLPGPYRDPEEGGQKRA